jgi:hypothetical protein
LPRGFGRMVGMAGGVIAQFPSHFTGDDVLQHMRQNELVYNCRPLFDYPPGCVQFEGTAKPISRSGHWEVSYHFRVLPPMIGEGI